ncbi:MAG: glycosyltransferase family 2 protein [Halieaceae bacterium]
MTVAAVVVNWQNWPDTKVALNSLLALPEWRTGLLSVCIVDNGSKDGSVEAIQDFVNVVGDERIRLLCSSENRGYAAGCNIGICWAHERSSEFVWLLNNDVELETSALSALIFCAGHRPEVKIWGSTILNASTGELEYAGGGYYNPWLSLQRSSRGNTDAPLDFIYGAAMFVRADVFTQFGLMNEKLFLYYEELDLICRMGSDSNIAWCEQSVVRHIGAASSGTDDNSAKLRQFHENLSTFKFTRSHYPYCLPSVVAVRILIKPVLYLARGQWFLITPLVQSLLAAFRE